jgi:hypothetical protein
MMKTNYLAVIVAAVVYWILGAIWFAVLFGKAWIMYEHITDEQMRGPHPVYPYIVSMLLNIVIAYMLSQICLWRNANTAGRGAAVGALLWLGIVGPITFTTYMYEMRPKEIFAINEFYPLAGLIIMGAIVGGWTKKTA